MEGLIQLAAGLVRALRRIQARKWSFLGLSACIFLIGLAVLGRLGLLPDAPAQTNASASAPDVSLAATVVPASAPELPVKVVIPAISLSVSVSNPDTTDVTLLDQALLSGAVRYPTSAELGQENGNVVIFGHSSYLPVVGNLAYKTFDGIQKLQAGDTITVYGSDAVYTYAVRSVSKESANSGNIPLSVLGETLTLATCDSFGKKTDRFVVTADFAGRAPLPGNVALSASS